MVMGRHLRAFQAKVSVEAGGREVVVPRPRQARLLVPAARVACPKRRSFPVCDAGKRPPISIAGRVPGVAHRALDGQSPT